ncbi:alpha/beta hydrolase [Carboxylicivirga mesophila]|uniref:Alpha/beta hydrolase n=1 Tax=Carboxylicivirga mesophila TaxID=1166478 RepID=A0ABS5K472_9BACT|nr:alpha/beta hydrolase-fold protein [Carboxylicivirga mesophila]MBS2209830.1 alpha/beta hydrolase [Carboxylicivirga mesophila]
MKTTLFLTLLFLSTAISSGQAIKIGFKDSIQSNVLNETRKFIVKLPRDYNNSDKSYPVLYRLDGDLDTYTETVGTINRLVHMDELIPDMIVVMIENTNRNRDMMPTNTSFFTSKPGAVDFKKFIENELVSHINSSYRTTHEKLLCGQSLSAIFTIYYFLTSPNSFDSFIACSGGFPECEEYFIDLTNNYLKVEQDKPTNLFLTHGMTDFLDPEGVIKEQLVDFSQRLESKNNISCKLKIYEDEGHVPFQSLYHGLRFIYTSKDSK